MWKVYHESMLYPAGEPIPYTIWHKRDGECDHYKMVLGADAPDNNVDRMAIAELADLEIAELHGKTAIEMLDEVEHGRQTFAVIWIGELVDRRYIEPAMVSKAH